MMTSWCHNEMSQYMGVGEIEKALKSLKELEKSLNAHVLIAFL